MGAIIWIGIILMFATLAIFFQRRQGRILNSLVIKIFFPSGGVVSSQVRVQYVLTSQLQSNSVEILAEYSGDGGATFSSATEAVGVGSEGISGLSSSLGGDQHTFIWDSPANLNTGQQVGLIFRITAKDGGLTSTDLTPSFDTMTGLASLAIDIIDPGGGIVNPQVRVRYVLTSHPPSNSVEILAEYSDDGGATFSTATEAVGVGSEGITSLSSSAAGDHHIFIWDSPVDLGSSQQTDLNFRITATDGGLTETDSTPSFDTMAGLVSSIKIVQVRSNRTDPFVSLIYELTDTQPGMSRVKVEYSDDSGLNWYAASEAPNQGSEGLVGLSASSAGDHHKFVWAAIQDLGSNQATNLLLKVEALDTSAGGSDITSTFSIGLNTAPVATFLAPRGGTVQSPVMVRCLIQDADSDLASIVLSFSVDGGLTFNQITPGTDSWNQPWSNLSTSPDGEPHLFSWDATADVGSRRSGIILRAEAADVDQGPAADSQLIDVDSAGSNNRIQILNPVSGTYSSPVPFQYRLTGQGPFDISISFSTDQGLIFRTGTPDLTISDPVTGLVGGSQGQTYQVFWNAEADLPGLAWVDDVYVKIEAIDAQQNNYEDTTGPIDLDLNRLPTAEIISPGGNQVSSPVYIRYLLKDFENDFINVDVQWSNDQGATFTTARELLTNPDHDGTRNLSSSYTGEDHTFVWDAPVTAQDVLVRIEPRDPKRGPAIISQAFDIGGGTPAQVVLHSPGLGVIGAPVPIMYTVVDTGIPVSAVIEYSIQGSVYVAVTEAAGARSEGLTNLATSSVGVKHFYAWDFEADSNLTIASDVRVRLTIYNAHGSTTVESENFTVDVSRWGTPCSRNVTRQVSPPEVQVLHGTSASWTATLNHFPVRFFVSQSANERCNVVIEYRDAQGNFRPITPADDSDDSTNLAAPYHARAGYRVLWNVLADMGIGTHNTVVRITPYIGAVIGPSDTTTSLQITVPGITALPQVEFSTAPTTVTLDKVAGDQIAIAGLLAPTVLEVDAKDGSDNLTGVRVSFAVVSSTGPDISEIKLEQDFDLASTTDFNGHAGVRVRTKSAQTAYTVEISARVGGYPSATQIFTLDVRPGVFVASSLNPTKVSYGERESLSYHLVADPTNTSRLDFLPDLENPISVEAIAVNGELSHSKLRVPNTIGQSNIFSFQVSPNLLGSTGTGVVSTDAVQMTISSSSIQQNITHRIPIETPYNTQVLDGVRGAGPPRQVRLHLELVEGLEPGTPPTSQVAYGGVTLTRKFRVELRDDAGNSYVHAIDRQDQYRCALGGGTISITRHDLEVTWNISSGEFKYGTQTGSSITVPITAAVEFTPEGPGPWRPTASVNAVAKLHQSVSWFWGRTSTNPGYCRAQHGVNAYLTRSLFVQRTTDITLLDNTATTRTPLTHADPGQQCRVEVSGLSDFRVSGQLEPIELETTRLDGHSINQVSGYNHKFKQDLPLITAGSGRLRSASFTLVRGEPASPPSATHAIIRQAWVRLHFYEVVFSIPTENPQLERELFKSTSASLVPDLASAHESPTGSTPVTGIGGTVLVHNGEFTYDNCDISFSTRVGALGVCRSYSDHSRWATTDRSSLGPGWFLEWDENINVSTQWIRWQTGDGQTVDFTGAGIGDSTERGHFFQLRRGNILDHDNSPYYLVSPQGDETHFHVDGSLRFTRDRHGNRFDFQYNIRGELERVYDCMTRIRFFAFEYFHGSGATPDPREGRLTKITDYTNRRTIDLEYYTSPPNKAGLLREVKYPAVPTVVGGTVQSSRRPQTYDYWFDSGANVFRLETIKDAENKTLIKNEFIQERVDKQSHETSNLKWQFAYDATTRTTTVTDGEGNPTAYQFPASPYPDGVAPSNIVTTGHAGATFKYNRDGLLLEATYPDGNKALFRYQEFITGSSPLQLDNARSRANLLRSIEVATSGEERVSSFSYDSGNRPLYSISPRGNSAGADPLINRVHYKWNSNTKTLENIFYPPVLNTSVHELDPVVIATGTTSGHQSWYSVGWRSESFEYTPDGRVSKGTDKAGVVTNYLYYPETDWNGLGGNLPTASGGGLLGEVIEDAEDTTDRDLQLNGVTLAKQTTKFKYDDLGNLKEMTDPRGIAHEMKINEVHEAEELIEASRGPGTTTTTPIRPARRKLSMGNDIRGITSKVKQEEPAVPPEEGGPDIFSGVYDHLGLQESTSLAVDSSNRVNSEVERDGNLNILITKPPGFTQFPESGTTLSRDERGLVDGIEIGGTTTSLRKAAVGLTANGSVESFTLPGNLEQSSHFDPFREETGTVDPRGHTTRIIKDKFGSPTCVVRYHAGTSGNPGRQLQPPNSEIGGFAERRYDEHGRLVRVHVGLFRPGATPSTGTSEHVKKSPDYQEAMQEPWPPVTLTDVEDSNWGPCDGRVTSDYSYDTRGLLTRVVDDNGAITLLRRDGLGRIIQYTSDSGRHVVTNSYDENGNVTSSTLGITFGTRAGTQNRSFSGSTRYDARNRPHEFTDGKNKKTSIDYSPRGSVNTATDSRQNTSILKSDGLGRIRQVDVPVANNPLIPSGKISVVQDYYNSSVIKSITDDAKNTTTVPAVSPPQSAEWLYDSEGRLEAIKYAGSQASSSQDTFSRMTYDPVTGFVDTIEDAEGVVLKYHYDTGLLNRLEVTSPVNPQGTREMSFNYDGDDRLTTGKDVTTGHEIQLEYDSLDGVVAEKQGTHRVTYSREGERRRTMLHHPAPGAFLVTYTVDRQGRLAHIRVGNRLVVRFQYRLPTQLRRRTQGLLRSDYEHDDNGVVETITITGFASGNDLRFDITRDNDGRIETCSQTQGAVNISWTWEYDEPGRIKSEVLLTDNAGTIEQVTTTRLFDGDDVLRREQIQVSDGTTTLSGNTFERTREERGRILSETNAPTLTYDKNGNLIQFGTTEYKFDAWQRLIQVLRGGQIIADYEYDTLHRLVLRRTPEDVETYIYDGGHLIEVRRDDEVIERYVYSGAIDDAVYAEISSDQYHVLSDPMGNIHAVVDAQGQVRQFYRYSLRGRCEVLDAGYNVVTESPAVRLLFQRRVWDSVSGLYYFRARWYSSELGIFLTADPSGYGEGTEHYGLNHGDSINFTDPFGLDDKPNNAGDVADGLKKAGRQRTPVAVRDLAALRGEFHVVEHFKDIPSDEAVIAITKTGERQVWIDPKSERWRRIFGKEFTDIAGDVDHVYSKARAKQQGYGYVRLADVPAGPNRSAGAGWEKKILKLPIQPGGTPAVRYSSLKDETKLSGIKVGGKRKGYPGMQLFARRIRRIPVVKIIAPLVFSYAVLKTGDARAASRSFFTPSQEKLRREWPDAPMVEWERAVANDVAMQDPFAVAGEIHNVAFERHLERVMPQREVAWHKMSAVDIRPEEKRRISLAAKGPGGMVLANILAIPDRIEGAWDDNVATPVTETYDRIIHLIDYGEWK